MYLSKLEMFGFKSFANKTQINFTKGITGIVGPNGCGKTNIVDGIRWVLGEQKTSTLRSDKMENVIFNGTRNRKPMGMAEISLTLINDNGVLPTEYSEITISRRIFRSGESEYLLNKNICRLKDITNLFLDTGMGSNAYSVIELKMIETILNNKADERRSMFEEAAGVNKYKLRRRLSLKKLDEVKVDLVRINDIVAEVDKTVRSLQRQAKRADKFNQIQSILRDKELNLAEREFSKFTRKLNELQIESDSLDVKKIETDSLIKEIETELVKYRDIIYSIENELTQKRFEINKESEKLHEFQKLISVAAERIRSLNINITRYKDEISELRNQFAETDAFINNNKEKILEFDNSIAVKKEKIEHSRQLLSSKKDMLDQKRAELKLKTEKSNELSKHINSYENSINNQKELLGKNNIEIEKLNGFIQKTTSNIAKTVGYLEDLNLEKEAAQKSLNESDALLARKQLEKQNLERQLNALKQKELDQKNILSGLRNKIELLQTLIANLEGVSNASKSLIANSDWESSDKTLFADVGNTDEKYRFALDAALKNVLNNILIENTDVLLKAVKYLEENELGKASFFLLKQQNGDNKSLIEKLYDFSFNRKIRKVQKETDFIDWAYNLVQAEKKWEPYFTKVLRSTVVTYNLDTAVKLANHYPSFAFVTLNGDLVQNNGIIEAGSLPKLDETFFGRKKLLEELKLNFPSYEKELNNIISEISSTEEKINSIDLKNISDQGRTLINEINNIEKQISQFEFEKNKYSEEIDNAQKKIQMLAIESTNIDKEISVAGAELDNILSDEIATNESAKKCEIETRHIQHDYDSLLDEVNKEKVELERLLGALQNTENENTRHEQAKIKILDTIAKRENEIESSNGELLAAEEEITSNQSKYNEIDELRKALFVQEDEIANRLKSIKEEALKFENELSSHRNERQNCSDKMHDVDLKINELSMRRENVLHHIKDEYDFDLELKEFEDAEIFNLTELAGEVHDYKQKLKELGPINLLAYSEYEEENERLQFLLKQRDDLIESEKDLIKTINEINESAERLFIETFEKIKENFIKIFRTLFDPGDEVDLLLQEGVDPLEAKIEIVAKPKGKRPTSIELLSGGEKTLTATALLFAIYLVKPSPFCILDEVDAPLDDANIDRFTRLLKEFSNDTQFIIITHNKRTMIAAENMYGVTMQEEGISKIAGVQFNDQLDVQNSE